MTDTEFGAIATLRSISRKSESAGKFQLPRKREHPKYSLGNCWWTSQEPGPAQPVKATQSKPVLCCVHAQSLQSCPTLCDSMDCSPPGSFVHGISQVRILEWVAMPSPRNLPNPGVKTHISYISCTGRGVLYLGSHMGFVLTPTKIKKPSNSQFLWKCHDIWLNK